MIVLAIETATLDVAAALIDDSGVLGAFAERGTRRHVETLHPGIAALLADAGIAPASLGGIAVDIGPGLFTGLRVGTAAAKAFAAALRVPIIGATSIEILRAEAVAAIADPVVPVIDLRRGDVAWALPDRGEIQFGSLPALAAALLSMPIDAPVGLVGDGVPRGSGELEELLGEHAATRFVVGPESLVAPSAMTLGRLALERFARGGADDAYEIVPMYLREPDARANFATRSALVAP